jgi:hypothetical protein
MKTIALIVIVLASMLAVTSVMADQASLVTRLENNPTEDFSAIAEEDLPLLADDDAIAYFQRHKGRAFDAVDAMYIGTTDALRHGLMGTPVTRYSSYFALALQALTISKNNMPRNYLPR